MKKQQKTLIILGIVFVVLIAGYLIISGISTARQEADAAGIILTQVEKNGLATIEWTHGDAHAVFVNDGQNTWHIEDNEDFPLKQAYPRRMRDVLSEIKAKRVITDVSESQLRDYGLDVPVFSLLATETSGNQFSLQIGLLNEKENAYYAIFNGDSSQVYLMDPTGVPNAFEHTYSGLMEMDSPPTISWLDTVHIQSNQGWDWELFYVPQPGDEKTNNTNEAADVPTWFTKNNAGVDIPVQPIEYVNGLVSHLGNLWLVECADWQVTEDDLIAYDLADPLYTVTVEYTETDHVDTGEKNELGTAIYEEVKEQKTFVLQIGNSNEIGTYAIMPEISEKVYLIHLEIRDLIDLIREGTDLQQAPIS